MEEKVEKVCPNCGNGSFLTKEVVVQNVHVDGNGNVIRVVDENPCRLIDYSYKCVDCSVETNYNELVSEAYFHEVISQKAE